MRYPLITTFVLLGIFAALAFHFISGGIADILLLGTLAYSVGPLRLIEVVFGAMLAVFKFLFRIFMIAGI